MEVMIVSKRYIYLLGVLLLFNIVFFVGYLHVINQTDGMWVYPLDDTYIHMQIAKNISECGYYGYTENVFCSSSSSPLYTFSLAICNKLFGESLMTPFVLNVVFANILVVVLYQFLKKRIVSFLLMFIFLFSPVLLPILVYMGMEHIMHILLITSTFIIFYNLIKSNYTGGDRIALVLMCCFLCLARYESMFFIFILSIMLLLNKQYKLSLAVSLAGFLPVVFFGLFSLHHGGWFFPNSLLLKGNIELCLDPFALATSYLRRFHYLRTPLISIPLLLLFLFLVYDFKNNKKDFITFLRFHSLIIVVLITIVLHAMFASFGLLFRYEAYLYALLYLTLVLTFFNPDDSLPINSIKLLFKRKIYAIILLPILVLCLWIPYRAAAATYTIYYASKNVYDQHIQMARFLQTYYNNSGVMANDVGAIQYYTNIKLNDLIGLTSSEVLEDIRKKGDGWSLESYFKSHPQVNNQYPIILIYDSWFGIAKKSDYEKLGWIKTGDLCIPDNVVCGDSKVSFYTSNRDEARQMVQSLKEFKKTIPKDVILEVYE